MDGFKHWAEWVGVVIDGAGVAVIVLALLYALARFARALRGPGEDAYRGLRQDLGRGILLGLELLVAADIIRTVAVSPTIDNALALGLIVIIRTFLSLSIEVEVEGRWPWQRAGGRRAG